MKLAQKHCIACNKGIKPLTSNDVNILIKNINGWKINDESKSLHKSYAFKNFSGALDFTNKIGAVAEAENHHPDFKLGWGYVNITLQTHSIGGLHENDFILAAKIDELQ